MTPWGRPEKRFLLRGATMTNPHPDYDFHHGKSRYRGWGWRGIVALILLLLRTIVLALAGAMVTANLHLIPALKIPW
jgi:hypothetical protein